MNKQYIRTLLDESIRGVTVLLSGQVFRTHEYDPLDINNDVVPHPQKQLKSATHLFLTRLEVSAGEFVVFHDNNRFRIGQILEVHDEPPILENDTTTYDWIVDRVDVKGYEELISAEKLAIEKITQVSRGHHRRLARTSLLDSFPELANVDAVDVGTPP